MQLQEYFSLLSSGSAPRVPVTGLCGRIIRGTKPTDFESLTDDPSRKVVMLMGPDGLALLPGKNGYDMLVAIGYEPSYILHKVKGEGNQFKLVVFPEGGPAKLATWDNVVDTVSEVYGGKIAEMLRFYRAQLKGTPFKFIEARAGFKFLDVDKTGKSDPRFMTQDRFESISGTPSLVDMRAFLYFTCYLKDLFRGDGYTYDDKSNRGMMEYIVPNKRLCDLGQHQIVDINVVVPSTNGKGATMNASATSQVKTLPLPPFFDPARTDQVWRVPYADRAIQAQGWAKANNLSAAANDRTKIGLLIIDAQNTFCIPDFELFVGGRSGRGAVDDNNRLCEFIYRYLAIITAIFPTMDTHTAMQIFHSIFLVDQQGNNPDPHYPTLTTLQEIESGKWQVNPAVVYSLARDLGAKEQALYAQLQQHLLYYAKQLCAGGKYALTIWPYHAMLGGIGHALVSAVEEALFFHNIARRSQTGFQIKGGNPLTENYSILRPEVLTTFNGTPIAQKNTKFIQQLLTFDKLIIAGQAASHCVAWTTDDLLNEINANAPELARKVYIMTDCTSAVVVPNIVDFTDQACAAFDRFAAAGMHVVKSTDPIETWPDMNL